MRNLRKLIVTLAFGAGLLLLSHPAAAATIIGSFRYETDPLAGTAVITVENFDPNMADFNDILVDLETTNSGVNGLYGFGVRTSLGGPASFILGATGFVDFSFSPLPVFNFANLPLDPLIDILIRASLTLEYQGTPITDTPDITLLNPAADIMAPASTVPEPATLLLLGSGAAMLAARRRRRTGNSLRRPASRRLFPLD